ncbi:acyl-CoA thioesterase [Bacteroidota bacterium]
MDETSLYKHKINITVRFSDLDALGHVNNATYLSYIQDARILYFKKILKRKSDNLDYKAIIARVEIDYKNQICLGDKVVVNTRCTSIGEKSCDVENLVVIEKGVENIIAAHCLSKLVAFDYRHDVTTPIPDTWRIAINEFEGLN